MSSPESPEVSRRSRRARSIEAAAFAGIACALFTALALIRLSRYPSLELDDEELAAWFDDDTHQTWLIAALGLASVGSIAFLWFVAVIRRRVGDLEDRFFSTAFLGSGILYVAVWLCGAAVLAAPAVAMTQLDAASVSPASASLAGGVGAALILVVAPRLQAVFIFTTSTVIMRSRVLPSWLAVVGYLTGLGLLVFPLISTPAGLVFPAWVLVVSIVLLATRPADLKPSPVDWSTVGSEPREPDLRNGAEHGGQRRPIATHELDPYPARAECCGVGTIRGTSATPRHRSGARLTGVT